MVGVLRSLLAPRPSLGYRGGLMTEERTTDDVAEPPGSRPWTLEAAMQPLPPLAPPPAQPGMGVSLTTTPRPTEGPPGPRAIAGAAILVLVVAVVVIVLLVVR